MNRVRFFYHPESDCILVSEEHPGDQCDEIDEVEYMQILNSQLHVWPWEGRWWVVRDRDPQTSCDTRDGALEWVHGRTGLKAKPENIHG